MPVRGQLHRRRVPLRNLDEQAVASDGGELAEHWNGSTWTIQPTPTPSGPIDDSTGLHAVSCTSVNRCTAVGGAPGNIYRAISRWPSTNSSAPRPNDPSCHSIQSGPERIVNPVLTIRCRQPMVDA